MKTAVFSNGHTDIYKGKRDVKAAWMITLPCGGIVSGHSLDRVKAEKTARSQPAMRPAYVVDPRTMQSAAGYQWAQKTAKENGFKDAKEMIASSKEKNAKFQAQCKIEIIDLV